MSKRTKDKRRRYPMEFRLDPVRRDEFRITLSGFPTEGAPLPYLVQALPAIRAGLIDGGSMRVDSCIACSAIIAGLALAMGLDAVVQSVRVDVYNAVLARWLLEHDREPTPAETQALFAEGGWSLVTGDDGREAEGDDGWNGHLVVLIRGDGGKALLIDPSFDQFSRPAKAIPIDTPFVGPWSGRWSIAEREDGVVVRYEARDNQGYVEAPDWTRKYVIILNGVESSFGPRGVFSRLTGSET